MQAVRKSAAFLFAFSVLAAQLRVQASPAPLSGRRVSPFRSRSSETGAGTSRFSLWAKQGDGKIHPLYQTGIRPRRRISEGDIIHILVNESVMATITANTDLKRRFEVDAQVKDWVHFDGLTRLIPSARSTQPGVDFRSERRTQGTGRRDRRDRIVFRIAGIVAWDLGDGTLFVTARKAIRLHDEESILILSGYVRREDIDEKRSVRSENIHDLSITYSGSGSLTANYTRSFWGWLLDLLWF